MGKYTREILAEAVQNSDSLAGVMRYLGIKSASGGTHANIRDKIRAYELDTSHFLSGNVRGARAYAERKKVSPDEVFVIDRNNGRRESVVRLRRALDAIGRPRECANCGQGETWKDQPLVLEINHKNGKKLDNRRENLEYLCPNCHSQLSNGVYKRAERKSKPCPNCGQPMLGQSRRCQACYNATRDAAIDWPPDLADLVLKNGLNATARMLGVSPPSVRRHLTRPPIPTAEELA